MVVLECLSRPPSTLSTISMINNPRPRYHRQRKAHHKVKTGCKACKVRRQKVCMAGGVVQVESFVASIRKLICIQCDEQKPICSGCRRHSTECLYQTQKRSRMQNLPSRTTEVAAYDLSCTSPEKSLQITPSSELNLGDLELMHQFLTSTCIAPGQSTEITAYTHSTMLPLGQSYPFVMRGMLAMAATHLSRLRPARQEHYAVVAARNHDSALPAFQSALLDMNEQNCQALIFYAKSLLWCSLASDESCHHPEIAAERGNNWLPPWFRLLRGSCQVVESSRRWITDGPHVLHDLDACSNDSVWVSDEHHLDLLTSHLLSLTDSTLCATILASLQEAFARAAMRHHSTPVRNAINFWIGSLPNDFIRLLYKKEPWALVTLAHFCVLFDRFETLWFMKGHATHLLLLIHGYLDANWRSLLKWPCEELGVP